MCIRRIAVVIGLLALISGAGNLNCADDVRAQAGVKRPLTTAPVAYPFVDYMPAGRQPQVSSAGDSVLTFVGGCMWGGMRDAAVRGDYVFVVMYHGLGVFDIGNPAAPTLVAFIVIQFNVSMSISLSGDYAYLLDLDGVKVVDISDPLAPFLVAWQDVSDMAVDIAAQGNYAYVVLFNNGLQIMDISNPYDPTPAGACDFDWPSWAVVVRDTLAFIANGGGGLRVINVADPLAPLPIGNVDGFGEATDLAVSGTYAYLSCGTSGLGVVDISDPALPALVTTFPTTVPANYIQMKDTILYVSGRNEGLDVISVAVPSQPVIVGNSDAPGKVCGMDDYLYMVNWGLGLMLIDINNPETPFVAGEYLTYYFGNDVLVKGDYAYGVSGVLQLVDVSDRQAPAVMGRTQVGNGSSVDVLDTLAYVVGTDSMFRIINVADPQAPQVISELDSVGYAYDVEANGSYAFVTTFYDGLIVIDISDPQFPFIAGTFPEFRYRDIIELVGDRLYMSGLQIINVSDPLSPYVEGSCSVYGSVYDMEVVDTLAYLATGTGELMMGWFQIVNVASPQAPVLIATYQLHNEAIGVAVSGTHAFIVDYYSLMAFDVSTPDTSILVSSYPGDGFHGIDADDNYVYVASQYGFLVFGMEFNCGDANGDGLTNVGDAVSLINYVFRGGAAPAPVCLGDANGDGATNVGDAVHMIAYVFKGGAAPVETCCE